MSSWIPIFISHSPFPNSLVRPPFPHPPFSCVIIIPLPPSSKLQASVSAVTHMSFCSTLLSLAPPPVVPVVRHRVLHCPLPALSFLSPFSLNPLSTLGRVRYSQLGSHTLTDCTWCNFRLFFCPLFPSVFSVSFSELLLLLMGWLGHSTSLV